MAEVSQKLSFFDIKNLEQSFIEACSSNDVQTVKDVIEVLGYKKETNFIKKIINNCKLRYLKFIKKQNIIDSFLIKSCQKNNVEVVKYLITSEELDVHPSEKAQSENSLRWSLGNMELIRYLITSPDLKKKPSVHFGNDFLFRQACSVGNKEMLQFLIFECDINKTEKMLEYLAGHPCAEAERLFNLRGLKKSLGKDLKSKDAIDKKLIKI